MKTQLIAEYKFLYVFSQTRMARFRVRFYPDGYFPRNPELAGKPFFSAADACSCLGITFVTKDPRGFIKQPSFFELRQYAPAPELLSKSPDRSKSTDQIRWVLIGGIAALMPKALPANTERFKDFLLGTVLPFARDESVRLANPDYRKALELVRPFLGFKAGSNVSNSTAPDAVTFAVC